MPKFLIEYKHVEETTYKEWVEGETEEEAILKTKDYPSFERATGVQGIEVKGFKVIETD